MDTVPVTILLPKLPEGFIYTGEFGVAEKHEHYHVVVERNGYVLTCLHYRDQFGFNVKKTAIWRPATIADLEKQQSARFRHTENAEWSPGELVGMTLVNDQKFWVNRKNAKYAMCEILTDDWLPGYNSLQLPKMNAQEAL